MRRIPITSPRSVRYPHVVWSCVTLFVMRTFGLLKTEDNHDRKGPKQQHGIATWKMNFFHQWFFEQGHRPPGRPTEWFELIPRMFTSSDQRKLPVYLYLPTLTNKVSSSRVRPTFYRPVKLPGTTSLAYFISVSRKQNNIRVCLLKCLRMSWNVLESLGMSWKVLECLGLPSNVLESLGMSWIDLKCLEKSWIGLECLGMSWNVLERLQDDAPGFNEWT